MRRFNSPAYSGPLFLSLLLLASISLHAQAPAAGTSVSVKMTDMVNSGSDPAGKQYRGSVTKTVDAGNGITIPKARPPPSPWPGAAPTTLRSSPPSLSTASPSPSPATPPASLLSRKLRSRRPPVRSVLRSGDSGIMSARLPLSPPLQPASTCRCHRHHADVVLGASPSAPAAPHPMTASAEPAAKLCPARQPASSTGASADGSLTVCTSASRIRLPIHPIQATGRCT